MWSVRSLEGWGVDHIPVLDFLTYGHQTQVPCEKLLGNSVLELSLCHKLLQIKWYKSMMIFKIITIYHGSKGCLGSTRWGSFRFLEGVAVRSWVIVSRSLSQIWFIGREDTDNWEVECLDSRGTSQSMQPVHEVSPRCCLQASQISNM